MTTDDEQHAARLESWYASHPGTCLLCAQKRLLARALAPWPHEGRTLLEVNCGPGLVEPHLRAMGLDVTGCEPSPALRNRFSSRLGYTYIVDPAHADLLPYGDASFDWVLLRLEHTKCGTDLAAVLGEARRVALKGVAVLVWNRWSLPALCDVRHTINASPQSAVRVFRELVSWHEGSVRVYGALFWPMPLWSLFRGRQGCRESEAGHEGPFLQLSDCLLAHVPLGLFGGLSLIRLDLPPSRPMTARPLRFLSLGVSMGSCTAKEASCTAKSATLRLWQDPKRRCACPKNGAKR